VRGVWCLTVNTVVVNEAMVNMLVDGHVLLGARFFNLGRLAILLRIEARGDREEIVRRYQRMLRDRCKWVHRNSDLEFPQ
jgi:hypothetical protein